MTLAQGSPVSDVQNRAPYRNRTNRTSIGREKGASYEGLALAIPQAERPHDCCPYAAGPGTPAVRFRTEPQGLSTRGAIAAGPGSGPESGKHERCHLRAREDGRGVSSRRERARLPRRYLPFGPGPQWVGVHQHWRGPSSSVSLSVQRPLPFRNTLPGTPRSNV